MTTSAEYWIERLHLKEHPEGGYFAETYRAAETVAEAALPGRFRGPRAFSTAIYFLLKSGAPSRLHRLNSDEVWHFYAGSTLSLHVLRANETYTPITLGPDVDRGQVFQTAIPAGAWFGATVDEAESFALVGCTVAPGFDFADFELGRRAELLRRYPAQRELIERLTQ